MSLLLINIFLFTLAGYVFCLLVYSFFFAGLKFLRDISHGRP